jgi:hypothetical protein
MLKKGCLATACGGTHNQPLVSPNRERLETDVHSGPAWVLQHRALPAHLVQRAERRSIARMTTSAKVRTGLAQIALLMDTRGSDKASTCALVSSSGFASSQASTTSVHLARSADLTSLPCALAIIDAELLHMDGFEALHRRVHKREEDALLLLWAFDLMTSMATISGLWRLWPWPIASAALGT